MASSIVTSLSSNCTGTDACDRSSSTAISSYTALPTITMTTTIKITVSEEEYTSTETVTVTPYVTTTEFTVVTLSSTSETAVTDSMMSGTCPPASIQTVTVYLPQPSVQAQTESIGTFVSTVDTATTELVTATVIVTVFPEPAKSFTTPYTDSVAASFDSAITVVTSLSTSTIMPEPGTPTIVTYATTFTVTDMAFTALSATHTPIPVSGTSAWSMALINGTSSAPVQSVPLIPATSTQTSAIPSTGSSISGTNPAPARDPVRSDSSSSKKPRITVFWGGSNGGGSGTCVVMLMVIVSLITQFLMM
ncbi:hypothetical protein GGS21DRAFT_476487 [Xylaria nigripes]|nr:hypothetical protein GGS21DRAFT_476487 [Xylaria nigripes]